MTTCSSPRLLLPAVRTPLLAFLSVRELVMLLATCRTLRDDDELLDHLLDRSVITRQLVMDAISEWWVAHPEKHVYPIYYWDHYCEWSVSHKRPAYPHELQAPGRRASLVSLAVMLATQLEAVMIDPLNTPIVTSYSITPFILPLTRRFEYMTSQFPTKGHSAALRCHLENCVVDEQGHVECALCTATKSMEAEWDAYYQERQVRAVDEYYKGTRRDDADLKRDMIVKRRERAGLPPLAFIGDALEDALSEALAPEFYRLDAYGPFCKKKLRPLVALLHHRNGFKDVRHGLLKTSYIPKDWSSTSRCLAAWHRTVSLRACTSWRNTRKKIIDATINTWSVPKSTSSDRV